MNGYPKTILIFPAGMPGSLAFLERALTRGQDVIGASSLRHDPARESYPRWAYLPYVTAPDFDEALRQAIAEFDIGGVFTPNPVVWDYLARRLGGISPNVTLVNASPVERALAPYGRACRFAESTLSEPLTLAASGAARRALSALEIAALFHHADNIPGQCDNEKIRALCSLFCHVPAGDVVEIGSLWGKSAFVLAWLARRHGIGKVLCVDPWSTKHAIQKDLGGRGRLRIEEAFDIFRINLLPYAGGTVNYLRLPSARAAAAYRRGRRVVTDAFGATRYAGKIALLHIDGNHDYDNVLADMRDWSGLMAQGGWIVLDDYRWPYGDGPRRVGDEFLRETPTGCAFVMGGALFIQTG
ncbi:MAG: class I SAM-dependent methyltransferase [Zoogloeaceae bacterium]|jgi:hypothetical protein|nr:class I SAM-dependent methyltransferase [Zoogloeaceae bacterium]